MRTFAVEVRTMVNVTVDETKFTPEFMAEFRESFFHFDTLEEHVEHIAQLEARDVLDLHFTEGYGPLKPMGIEARAFDLETEIITRPEEAAL